MSLIDVIDPQHEMVLVVKDPPPDPMAGTTLVAAPSIRLDSQSGTVVKSGPGSWLSPGQRVIFGRGSATVLGFAGDRGEEVALLSSQEVLALHEPAGVS